MIPVAPALWPQSQEPLLSNATMSEMRVRNVIFITIIITFVMANLYYNSEVCVCACVCVCLSVCAGLFENS